MKIWCAALAVFAMAPAAVAQDSICFGLDCDTNDPTSGNINNDAYEQEIAQLALDNLISLGSEDDPVFKQCVRNCRDTARRERRVCNQLYNRLGNYSSAGLDNCMDAVNQRERRCISPASLLKCAPG